MSFTPPPGFTTRPTLEGSFGMVASTHWTATAAAQAVLERGGTAFDAAVAAGFVLHVVEPDLNGAGGDLAGLVAPAGGAPTVLMGLGPAPAGASIDHVRREGLDMVPGSGALAAAVPGAVDAWLVLLRDHGTWELADVLAFAIHYAGHGHPIHPRVAASIGGVAALFREFWPTSAAVWLPDDRVPAPGAVLRNPAYAAVLTRLAEAGGADRVARIEGARSLWREGFVAQAIDSFVRRPHRHASGTDHAGVLTAADMATFEAGYEEPLTGSFRGYEIAKTGPWGQGPVLLAALAILDGYPDAELDPSTAHGAHLVLEALKLALADREAHFGDGADVAALLTPGYAASRRALIGATASAELRPGPGGYLPPVRTVAEGGAQTGGIGEPTVGRAPGVGEPTVARSGAVKGDTCHLDVVDRWGNMVAVTPSGGWLQSSPTIPELGFCLGTRLQMAWLDERSPSALRPGARPRTTLSPTLVLRDGAPVAALGTPGGDQQDQWQLLYLLRTLVGGYTPQQAIDAPHLHTTAVPESFWPRTWIPAGAVLEDRFSPEVVAGLRERGHAITLADGWSLGRLSAVTRDPATGILRAAANPRGQQGYAAGR